MTDSRQRAHAFLAGEALTFKDADQLWKQLKKDDELALARSVLSKTRRAEDLIDRVPARRAVRQKLCQQEALLTSKDPELSAAVRHDKALEILTDEFDLEDPALDGDRETLGIAGGILKRRWGELGQLKDLKRAATLYARGAGDELGDDAYTQINSAFVEDVLAESGDDPVERRGRARVIRERIVAELPETGTWWNAAARAEAYFGLGRYEEATEIIAEAPECDVWELHSTARQLATLAHLGVEQPLGVPEIREFFDALLPGATDAIRSVFVGKVGLALSGGGFRASFYHLGVLARLAELNVLRHVDVLSCVSGGSIIGACYWLALRRRLLERKPLEREDYVTLVRDLISHFEDAVATDLRGQVQPFKLRAAWRLMIEGEKGVMDAEKTAAALEEHFLNPLVSDKASPSMHDLAFTPADHASKLVGTDGFHPGKHNWLRAHKVPALVLNATTVNTGHAWQFTPTWMGESPWAVYGAADSVPRLEWSWYQPDAGWQVRAGQAVAASACVPGIFEPLRIDGFYEGVDVQLVDGGVHDNQGTVALLAMNCNVLLVSDAAGQLLMENKAGEGVAGLLSYAKRSMDMLTARIRLANFAELAARRRSGLLRGLMFLHMKEGLDADTIRLRFSQNAFAVRRSPLSPSGVRKDFQQALAELRTDLDDFTLDESRGLMACGYQMATKAFQRDVAELVELWDEPVLAEWPFAELLSELTSTAATTARRDELLAELRDGSKIRT